MKKYYYDTPEEFLKSDNSYLLVKRNLSNIFSKAFWADAKIAKIVLLGQKETKENLMKLELRLDGIWPCKK